MKSVLTKVIAAVLAVAVIVTAIILIAANRPLVKAPKGTAPLDNRIDTSAVAHLVVDEAGVLPEETERIIHIYNANWSVLAGWKLAVVTVETTENAETEAWEWAERLELGKDDALLLMETNGNNKCALVANGKFREDLETLEDGYLERLTYMPMRAGDYDVAAMAVCARVHYFCGYDGESHRRANVLEGVITISIVGVVALPIFIHLIGEKIDKRRFKRWYDDYGVSDPSVMPWRTLFFWHRVGSKWYEARMSGEFVDIHDNIIENRGTQRAKIFSAGAGGRRR